MTPFIFSWMGLIVSPILNVVKNRKVLITINKFIFVLNYTPLFLITLVLFVAVNLLLLPFAYLKTIVHKYALF